MVEVVRVVVCLAVELLRSHDILLRLSLVQQQQVSRRLALVMRRLVVELRGVVQGGLVDGDEAAVLHVVGHRARGVVLLNLVILHPQMRQKRADAARVLLLIDFGLVVPNFYG